VIPGRRILVDDVRIRGIGRTGVRVEQTIPCAVAEPVVDMVRVHSVCQIVAFQSTLSYSAVGFTLYFCFLHYICNTYLLFLLFF